jgi:hypothetical protein
MTFDSREKSLYTGAPVECYRFVFGATTYLWTSDAANVVLPTGTYTPQPISRGAIEHSDEENSGYLQVKVPLDNPIVTPFMPYVPGVAIALTVYRAHRGEESLAQPIFFGTVISVVVNGAEATLTCAPFDEALQRLVPRLTYQPLCQWDLYGVGCGVVAASFRDTATADTVSGVTVTSSTFATRADGWYLNGWMDDPTGDVRMIVGHVGNTITLISPFASLIAGQTVHAFAGCDRTEATCTNKFNNFPRHLGFPRVPDRNPFVGTVA